MILDGITTPDGTQISETELKTLDSGTAGNYQDQIDDKIDIADKGAINGVAQLDGTGKVPQSQLPSIALVDTNVVASQAAMLALTAETGDIAIRTDLNKTFILAGIDPSVIGDWQEMLTPTVIDNGITMF